MKRIFRKNQIVVAALALLIAGAGYLNYTYENDFISQNAQGGGRSRQIAALSKSDSNSDRTPFECRCAIHITASRGARG